MISIPVYYVQDLEKIEMAQGRFIHTPGRRRRQRKSQVPLLLFHALEQSDFSPIFNCLFLLNDLSVDLTSVLGLVSVSLSAK